jgi:DNA-binding winged helix-turn-helix (wHTH) protein
MKESFPFMADLLEEAAQRIEDQRLWRGAWLNAESKVELLTSEINVLRSQLQHRKEKEQNG